MGKKYSNNHYNKDLKTLARNLRKNPTKAETVLWRELLSEKKMMGYRFLRQRPIGDFIVDFFSKELRLVIEVDGYTHQFEEVAEKDQVKDTTLKELGFEVLRFEDSEVLNDVNNVSRTIENWILDWEESVTP